MLHSRRSRAWGFTLIEIMVVLVILGIIGAVAVVRAPHGNRQLDVEAARFAAAIELMSEQAIVRGVPHAVDVEGAQYSLREFRGGAWIGKSLAGIAPVRKLPSSMRLDLVAGAAAGVAANRIVMLPSGIANADGFRLIDAASGDAVAYAANADGHFERVP